MGTPIAPNSVGEQLIEQWLPYMTPDLETYAYAIGSMFEHIDELIDFLGEEEEIWAKLLDPLTCPDYALPYLAQYVGERLPEGLAVAMQREWIQDAPNQLRGTLYSIARAAQRTLTGNRAVLITERSGVGETHPEDYIAVRTYASQTPDPAQVLRDLYAVVPADIELDYAVTLAQTWTQLKTDHPTWNDVKAYYAKWTEVTSDKAGDTSWDRPRPI